MSLENELKKNTAAVEALTAAISAVANVAAGGETFGALPTAQTPATPAEPTATEKVQTTVTAPASQVPAAEPDPFNAPASAPSVVDPFGGAPAAPPAPTVAAVPVVAPAGTTSIDNKTVTQAFIKLLKAKGREVGIVLLAEFGAKDAVNIPEEKREAVMARIDALLAS